VEEDVIRLCSASMAKWRLLEDSRARHEAQSSNWGLDAQDLAQLTNAALATEVLKRESGRKQDWEKKRNPGDAHELEAWRELVGEHEQIELESLKESRQRSLEDCDMGGGLGYEKLEFVSQCTFSKVYVGRLTGKDCKAVAIREFDLQDYFVEHKKLRLVLQETRKLRHPNLVRCYGGSYSRQEQLAVVVDELMDAGSLQGLITYLWHVRQKKSQLDESLMDETAIRKIMIAILSGIGHLHANGIVHGRLKPSKILLTCTGQVKVGGFGYAQLVRRRRGGKLLEGDKKFAAPEVLNGQEASSASDIWSLGCIVYFLSSATFPSVQVCQEPQLLHGSCQEMSTRELSSSLFLCIKPEQRKTAGEGLGLMGLGKCCE